MESSILQAVPGFTRMWGGKEWSRVEGRGIHWSSLNRGMKKEGLAKLGNGGEQQLRENPPREDMKEDLNTRYPLVLISH